MKALASHELMERVPVHETGKLRRCDERDYPLQRMRDIIRSATAFCRSELSYIGGALRCKRDPLLGNDPSDFGIKEA